MRGGRERERESVYMRLCERECMYVCTLEMYDYTNCVQLLSHFKSKHIRVDFHFSCEEINVIFLNSLFKSLNKKMIS